MDFPKKYKKSLIVTSIVIASIVVIIFILQLVVGAILTNKIENSLDKRSTNQYVIKVGKSRVNLFTMTIILKDITITPDSAYLSNLTSNSIKHADIYKLKVPLLRIRNISLIKLISNKFIDVNHFVIKNTHLEVYTDGKSVPQKAEKPKKKPILFNLDSIPLPGIGGGFIGKIAIVDFAVNIINVNRSDTVFSASSLILSLDDITLLKNESDSASFRLNLKDVVFKMSNEKFRLPGGKYILKFDEMSFNMNEQSMVLGNISIKPRWNRAKMVGLSKFQYEIFDVEIENAKISSINLREIIKEAKIYLTHVDVENMNLNIFKDKRNPFDESKRPKLPQQMLKSLKQELNIDSITINNSRLVYSERHELMKEPMKVALGNFNVVVKNITSVFDSIIDGEVMTIALSAKLQETIPMNIDIAFPMKSTVDTFMFAGYLGGGDMKIFNPIVLPAIGLKFESGILDKINFSANANPTYSIGKMTMLYHDLQGDVQRKDMLESNKFLSWVANSVIIRNNPAKDKGPRTVPLYFERVEYKGLGNFLWKTLQSGITATIIPTMKNKVQSQVDAVLGTKKKDIRKRDREEKRRQNKK